LTLFEYFNVSGTKFKVSFEDISNVLEETSPKPLLKFNLFYPLYSAQKPSALKLIESLTHDVRRDALKVNRFEFSSTKSLTDQASFL